MRFILVSAVVAALAAPAAAREPEPRREDDWPRRPSRIIAGPQLGLVFDRESGQLRRVIGLPGAASFGAAVDSGVPLVQAAPSPQQDSALGVTTEGRVVRILAGNPAQPLEVPAAPDRIVYSPGGNMAALLYAEAGSIAVVRMATGAARNVGLVGGDGAVGPFAVADDGTLLVTTSAGAVLLFEEEGMRLAGAVRRAAAAVFFPGSRDALVADDGDDQVFLLRDGGFAPIAGSAIGVAGPVAVETTGGGRRAVIANARTGTVLTVDLTDGTAELVECSCTPEALLRTSQPGAYWIGDRMVFEEGPSGRRVVFVAPAEGAAQ
jgi:hypothetical protein